MHKAAEREALKVQRCKAKTAPALTHKCVIENTVLSQGSSTAPVNETSKRMTESECSTNIDDRRLSKRANLTVDNTIFTDLYCVCFGSYEEDDSTGRSGYSALVTDGSTKTVY